MYILWVDEQVACIGNWRRGDVFPARESLSFEKLELRAVGGGVGVGVD